MYFLIQEFLSTVVLCKPLQKLNVEILNVLEQLHSTAVVTPFTFGGREFFVFEMLS